MGNQEIKIPPQNLDAERAVIGSMILDDEAIGVVVEQLDSSLFYDPAHQKIFQAIITLYSDRKNVDMITLGNQLQHEGLLDQIGGNTYLAELANFVPTTANVEHHANIVKEKGVQRMLIKNATEIVASSYGKNVDVDELIDTAESLIFEIATSRQKKDAVHIKDLVRETISTIDMLSQRKEAITGIPSGFIDIDKMTSGLQRSELIIVAGRPSMGKSAFAQSVVEHACIDKNIPCAFFSLEMSKQSVVQRMLCSQAMVDAHKVRTGFLSPQDWPLLTKAAGKMSNAPFFIDDSAGISVLELRAKARRLKASHDIQLIVLDYLQLMRGGARSESRQQEISEISRGLKALARELDVPIIAISQLSRAVESRHDHRPMLSDLRESGAIEQDADLVALLFREEYYNATDENRGIAEVIIAKQRNGPVGTVKLKFFKEYIRFVSLDLAHQEAA